MKKILAMVLVVLMLVTLLVSCKKDPEEQVGGDVTTPVSTDPNRVPPEVKDFGGYEFKFMLDLQTDFEFQAPEKLTGEGINDTIFQRNSMVGSLYNVKFSETLNEHGTPEAAYDFLLNMASSGEYYADVYSNYAIKMIQIHSVAGFYLDISQLKSLRLSEEWWDQDYLSEMTINGHCYTFTGDIQTNDDLHEIFTAMNLNLYEETYPEKNFYEIVVKNGAWTFEEFYNTWYGFGSSDTGTSGKVDNDDKVGYYYDSRTANYMYMASGMKAFTIENNAPVLTIGSEKAIKVMDYLTQITDANTNNKSAQIEKAAVSSGGDGSYAIANAHFQGGKALFISANFTDALQYYLDMEDTVVYPPFPKYEATQDRYYSLVHKDFEPLAISANVKDKERTALIVEALCFYSDKLEDEVMDILIQERLTSELEPREILRLTLNSKVYDIEYTANIMDWSSQANNLFIAGQLANYKGAVDSISKASVNSRGTGKLQLFLKSYGKLG